MMNLRFSSHKNCFYLLLALMGIFSTTTCSRHYLSKQGRLIHEQFMGTDHHRANSFMQGTQYETPYFLFATDKPDPTMLILAGTHGDEPAGYETAYRLMKYFSNHPMHRGRVFIVPETNRQAVLARKHNAPIPSRQAQERWDLDQCYPGKSDGLPMEEQAYEIVQLIREEGISLVLDLQESKQFYIGHHDTTKPYLNIGQTLIHHPGEKANRFGKNVTENINNIIPNTTMKFTILAKPIPHSAAWIAGERFNIPGFTIVTCKKLPLEERIAYQRKIVLSMLQEIGM